MADLPVFLEPEEPIAQPNAKEEADGLFVLPERTDPTQAPPHP
ncbi:hypothetical protein AB0F88_39760 [Streptosporangium sp. NPDC023963]